MFIFKKIDLAFSLFFIFCCTGYPSWWLESTNYVNGPPPVDMTPTMLKLKQQRDSAYALAESKAKATKKSGMFPAVPGQQMIQQELQRILRSEREEVTEGKVQNSIKLAEVSSKLSSVPGLDVETLREHMSSLTPSAEKRARTLTAGAIQTCIATCGTNADSTGRDCWQSCMTQYLDCLSRLGTENSCVTTPPTGIA